jgi:hypothetical protein
MTDAEQPNNVDSRLKVLSEGNELDLLAVPKQ